MAPRISGRWEGEMVDVTGPRAALVVDLKESRGAISGDFKAYFLPPDDSCCGDVEPRLAQLGAIRGKVSARTGEVRFRYEMSVGLKPVVVDFEAKLVSADPHARQAMCGCYDVTKGGEELTLEGGGCVLWRYA